VSAITRHTLTEDDFLARFKPVANHIDPNSSFDGCMFETFGEELAHVRTRDRNLVWTLLDSDGQSRIESGFHFVNRIGYLIASVPTEPDHSYSVAREGERGDDASGEAKGGMSPRPP
jgi:hypothetical protein